jgi:hypothetical protein
VGKGVNGKRRATARQRGEKRYIGHGGRGKEVDLFRAMGGRQRDDNRNWLRIK